MDRYGESETMRITDKTSTITYGKMGYAIGTLASDDFSFDENVAEGVDFFYVDKVGSKSKFASWQMDGVLGLAPSLPQAHLSSFVAKMNSQAAIRHNMFSLYLSD